MFASLLPFKLGNVERNRGRDFFCDFEMEKRSKKSMKSDDSFGLASLTSEDSNTIENGEAGKTLARPKVKPSEDGDVKKSCKKTTSEGNGKQSSGTTLQNKQTRSDLGRELLLSREIRGRTKLPPFRGGRYIPSDGYLYSSWNSDTTDEKSNKNGADKAERERAKTQEETKQSRIQSASFHGLEAKRTRPKLRTRCRSTDCGRVTMRDGIRLNHKMSHYGCAREFGHEKKSRCRSADLSQFSVQDVFNVRSNGSLPLQWKDVEKSSINQCTCEHSSTIPESHQQLFVNENPDNELAKQTLTAVDETASSTKPDAKASLDMRNRKTSPSKEKIALPEEFTENSPTRRKGKVNDIPPGFGSKDRTLEKDKPGTKSSPKRSSKNLDTTVFKMDALQKGRRGAEGTSSSEIKRNNRKSLTDKLDKSNLENSSAKDVSVSPSRKRQNSPGKISAGKTKSTSNPLRQGVSKVEGSCNGSHFTAKCKQESVGAALRTDNISAEEFASTEKKGDGNCSRMYADVNRKDSAQTKGEMNLARNTSTTDCKTQGNQNPVENKTNHVEVTTEVGSGVDKTIGDIGTSEGTNFEANCSHGAGNNVSAKRAGGGLRTEISGKNCKMSDQLTISDDTKNTGTDKPRGSVKLQRNYKTKVTKRPSNENKTLEKDQGSHMNKSPSEKNKHSEPKKNPSDKEVTSLNKDVEGKKTSLGGNMKYPYDKAMDYKGKGQSTESSRKLVYERRENYSKQLREKNMRNALLKKRMGQLVNQRNGVRLQEDSAITVKIKHVKSRRLLRRNVAYVKREQKEHFSQEHDHDSWVLFTVTLGSSLEAPVMPKAGLDTPDGRNCCKSNKTFIGCVLPRYGNVIPKVKVALVGSPKSSLKRLSILPVKKLRWSLFDGMVMYLVL